MRSSSAMRCPDPVVTAECAYVTAREVSPNIKQR